MEYGIVYLLTNPVMPGLVKISMTNEDIQFIESMINPMEFICTEKCLVDSKE